MQTLTPNGLKFIQSYEGCVLHAYKDIGGTPTIGWGMTQYPNGVKVKLSDLPLTQEEADTMFEQLVQPYCNGVIEALGGTVQLNSNQLCALTDFAYNCGVGAFQNSNLCQHVKTNTVTQQDFTIYDHIGSFVNQGLYNRRLAEYNLFITNVPNAETQTNIKMDINTESNMPTTDTEISGQDMHTVHQITKIKTITITFDRYQAGVLVQENATTTLTVTPELLTAMKLEDAGLVEGGYDVELVA